MSNISSSNIEKAVLSTCLNRLNTGMFSRITINAGNSPEEIFSEYPNRMLFKAIGSIYDQNLTPSIASVTDRLASMAGDNIEDPEEFITQVSLVTPISNVQAFDSAISDLTKAKTVRKQVKEIKQLLEDIDSGEADIEPSDISARVMPIYEMAEVEDDSEVISEIVEDILNSERPAMWTVSTGIPEVDTILGGKGLESGCLTVIAARPKVGKTIFMNSLINNVIEEGAVPLVINLETKKVEFIAKIIACHVSKEMDGELPWTLVKNKLAKDPNTQLTQQQEYMFQEGVKWAKEQNWRVTFNNSMNIPEIRGMIVNAKSELPENAKIVLFVDYIQRQALDKSREREEVSALTQFYKTVANELDISVVILAQINRDGANSSTTGRPYVHQLKSSGSIEQDADTVILLDRPAIYDNNIQHQFLKVYGSVTRLAGGEDFSLLSDGSTNVVGPWKGEEDGRKDSSNGAAGEEILPSGSTNYGDSII